MNFTQKQHCHYVTNFITNILNLRKPVRQLWPVEQFYFEFLFVFVFQEHKRTIRSAGVAQAHSAPVAGHVYDVTSGTPGVDIDYSVSILSLADYQ